MPFWVIFLNSVVSSVPTPWGLCLSCTQRYTVPFSEQCTATFPSDDSLYFKGSSRSCSSVCSLGISGLLHTWLAYLSCSQVASTPVRRKAWSFIPPVHVQSLPMLMPQSNLGQSVLLCCDLSYGASAFYVSRSVVLSCVSFSSSAKNVSSVNP